MLLAKTLARTSAWALSLVIAMACAPVLGEAPKGALAWSDEFDGAALDDAKWEALRWEEPYNNERQAYLPEQATVADGVLSIVAEKKPVGEKPFRSARLESRFAQQYGRWEVRAKLPGTRGTWPAIWLLPDTETFDWPKEGEIDIMENGGHEPLVTSCAFHYDSPTRGHHYLTQRHRATRHGVDADYHRDYHVYAVEWRQDEIRFEVDGAVFYTIADKAVEGFLHGQSAPMRTVLNVAVGGDFLNEHQPDATSVWPQAMLVDYVRVYRLAPQEPAAQNAARDPAASPR